MEVNDKAAFSKDISKDEEQSGADEEMFIFGEDEILRNDAFQKGSKKDYEDMPISIDFVPTETKLFEKTVPLSLEMKIAINRIIDLEPEIRRLIANQNVNNNKNIEITNSTTYDDEDAWNHYNEAVPDEIDERVETSSVSLEMKIAIKRIIDLEPEIRRLIANQNANNTDFIKKRSDASPKNTDNENYGVKSTLYANSTHRYLFMDSIARPDGTSYNVGWNHKVLALLVITFQFITYFIVAALIAHEIVIEDKGRKSGSLEIDSKYCYDTDVYGEGALRPAFSSGDGYTSLMQASITAEMLPNLIQCSDPTGIFNETENPNLLPVLIGTGFVLLNCFLLPDLIELFVLFKCKGWNVKLVSVLLFTKALLANAVGAFAVSIAFFKGPLDAFLLYVGLIFVHGVDEEVGKMQDTVEKMKRMYCRLALQFGVFFFGVLSPILYYVNVVVVGDFVVPMLYSSN